MKSFRCDFHHYNVYITRVNYKECNWSESIEAIGEKGIIYIDGSSGENLRSAERYESVEAGKLEDREEEDDGCDIFGVIEVLSNEHGALEWSIKEYFQSCFESVVKRFGEKICAPFTKHVGRDEKRLSCNKHCSLVYERERPYQREW